MPKINILFSKILTKCLKGKCKPIQSNNGFLLFLDKNIHLRAGLEGYEIIFSQIQEQDVFIDLVQHYTEDYKMISHEMNRTFGDKIFQPHLIKKVCLKLQPEKQLTKDEIQIILKIYSTYIREKKRRLWLTVGKFFAKFDLCVLRQKFINQIRRIIRKYIYIFGKLDNQYFYEGRLSKIGLLQFNAIYFFGQYTPNNLEKECQIIVDICEACAKLLYLVQYYLDNNLEQIDDPLDQNQLSLIPDITENEFEQIMERVITLEICYGIFPYNQIEEDEIQYHPVIEFEYEQIPQKRVIKIGSTFLEKHKRERTIGNDSLTQIEKGFFASLSSEQINHILQSQPVQFMISHISLLHRDSKEKHYQIS